MDCSIPTYTATFGVNMTYITGAFALFLCLHFKTDGAPVCKVPVTVVL
jgi:hypothetical protein